MLTRKDLTKFFLLLLVAMALFLTPIAMTKQGKILVGDHECAQKALAVAESTGHPVIVSCK